MATSIGVDSSKYKNRYSKRLSTKLGSNQSRTYTTMEFMNILISEQNRISGSVSESFDLQHCETDKFQHCETDNFLRDLFFIKLLVKTKNDSSENLFLSRFKALNVVYFFLKILAILFNPADVIPLFSIFSSSRFTKWCERIFDKI